VEDYEDDILHHLKKASPDASVKICAEIAGDPLVLK